MKPLCDRSTLTYVLRIAVFLCVNTTCFAQGASQLAAEATLFKQYETVVYANKNWAVRLASKEQPADKSHFFLIPFSPLRGALHQLGDEAFLEIMESSDGVLVGAKDFRLPKVLEGQALSTFCDVVLLQNESKSLIAKYFSNMPKEAEARFTVWRLSGNRQQGYEYAYASVVKGEYLLVSNSMSELRLMTEQLSSQKKDSRIFENLRDWNFVTGHELWGYRQFQLKAGEVSSVANLNGLITNGAEAIMFFFDSSERACVLRLLTSPKDERTAANIGKMSWLPPLRRTGMGVWQTTFVLADPADKSQHPTRTVEDNFERGVMMMSLFGFMVFI